MATKIKGRARKRRAAVGYGPGPLECLEARLAQLSQRVVMMDAELAALRDRVARLEARPVPQAPAPAVPTEWPYPARPRAVYGGWPSVSLPGSPSFARCGP